MAWIISANNKLFDYVGAFEKYGAIDWQQKVNYKIDDIVYIYSVSPIQRIQYKTIVEEIDLSFEESQDDQVFWKGEMKKGERYVKLKMLGKFDTEDLSLEVLLNYGLKAAPQGPTRLSKETENYINEVIHSLNDNLIEEYMEWTAENLGTKVGLWYGPKLSKIGTELDEFDLYPEYKNNFFDYKTFDEYKEVYKSITGESDETVKAIINGSNKFYPADFRENAKQYKKSIAQKEYDEGTRTKPDNYGGIPALGAMLRSYLKFLYYRENPKTDPVELINDVVEETFTDAIKYDKTDFLKEVYLEEKDYDTIIELLKHKKNIVIQGAPGVGKTYASKRIAWSMMGEKDESRIEMIQFHQNYSYEDFIMGYKPSGEGFKLEEGIFMNLCLKAEEDPSREYFLIIDEINRGNISKIFGELLMLIENNYRGISVQMPYNKESFTVPENLYIIGMMNTADRSLAMIDYALRRRFSFFDMNPGFSSKGFKAYQKDLDSHIFDKMLLEIERLNTRISEDATLGNGFRIGHSYFTGQTKDNYTNGWLKRVIQYDVLPMLNEYWFDDDEEVDNWENILMGVFNNES